MKIIKKNTRNIKIGNIIIWWNNKIAIQSMTNTKTHDIEATVKQIKRLEEAGCEIVRVAVLDENDAKSISEIKKQISIPLVADIHFDYKLAIISIDAWIDKLRINPGNIWNLENVKILIEKCKKNKIPIRIWVNLGSLDKDIEKKILKNSNCSFRKC